MRERRCARLFWQLGWAVVLAANLVVPSQLGLDVTRQGGRVGLVAAVVLLWVAGHLLLARVPVVGEALVAGGVVTALTQVYPVLQMMTGLTSLWVVEQVSDAAAGHQTVGGGFTEAEAFAATLLTAAQVAVVALVCGPAVRAATGVVLDTFATDRSPSSPLDRPHGPAKS